MQKKRTAKGEKKEKWKKRGRKGQSKGEINNNEEEKERKTTNETKKQ